MKYNKQLIKTKMKKNAFVFPIKYYKKRNDSVNYWSFYIFFDIFLVELFFHLD